MRLNFFTMSKMRYFKEELISFDMSSDFKRLHPLPHNTSTKILTQYPSACRNSLALPHQSPTPKLACVAKVASQSPKYVSIARATGNHIIFYTIAKVRINHFAYDRIVKQWGQ